MADRERKRAERRKRKGRSAERRPEGAGGRGSRAARTEAKNQAARDELDPLEAGERPRIVTVGAVISGVLAVAPIVLYAAGIEIDGKSPPITSIIAPVVLMGVMSWGLWQARYWAVLGFQTLLLIVIIATSLGLVKATKATQAIGNTAILIGAGGMFWFMIKAMARIQMPERR